MVKKSKVEREARKMERLAKLISSEYTKRYLKEGDKIKPFVLKILGNEIGRAVSLWLGEYIFQIPADDVCDYRDSMMPCAQLGAAYAALKILKGRTDSKILYLACSYGLGMRLLADAGYVNTEGIDCDKKAVDFCNSQGLKARFGDATETGFDGGSFDMGYIQRFCLRELWLF